MVSVPRRQSPQEAGSDPLTNRKLSGMTIISVNVLFASIHKIITIREAIWTRPNGKRMGINIWRQPRWSQFMRHLKFHGEETKPSSFSAGYHSFIYLWTSGTMRAAPTLYLRLPPPSYGQKYGPREYVKPKYTVIPITIETPRASCRLLPDSHTVYLSAIHFAGNTLKKCTPLYMPLLYMHYMWPICGGQPCFM